MNNTETITAKATITWVSIKWNGYPPATTDRVDLSKSSDIVLVSDGKWIDFANFIYALDDTPVNWFAHDNLTFVPTHWAYINLPA